ncbi:mitochondrial cardiolipin hydrolase [Rhineura floridana]|uniref:mitochondrial cardiolipin hydrolase n=1 Tax=Rhineura floridana TaxID=261503 RepID=UPI002AC88069|nr:mitochondrial cardiolipin hydrolase [Rhineura floridana]
MRSGTREGKKAVEGARAGAAASRPEATMWCGRAQVLLAVGLGMALEALACWLLRRWDRLWASPAVREVLFFPSRVTCIEELLAEAEARPVAPCVCPLPHGESALGRLLAHLLSARRSLELCVFAFSSSQLRRAVVLLHRRGVRVRVVTDTDYMALKGSQIGNLRQAGIQVRHDQDCGYMHHKFAIIDKKMLITGSLNWTTQAIQKNRENVLIVEDTDCVNIFLTEFEKIWEDYNPANYTFFPKEE